MDKIKKLFDVITRDGYYNKSFEEFQVQFQDEEYQTKVFDVVTRDGLFDKTFEEFKGMYSSPVVEEVVEKKNPNDTTLASASEDGGLGQSDTNIEVEPQDYRPDYTALASEVPGVAEAEFDNIEREKVKRRGESWGESVGEVVELSQRRDAVLELSDNRAGKVGGRDGGEVHRGASRRDG